MKLPVINFEGIDGAGKSFALEHLRRHYVDQDIPVTVIESISPSEFKKALDPKWYDMSNPNVKFMEYLSYEVNNYYKNIVPNLGKSVILVDRYFPSCFAYNILMPLDPRYVDTFMKAIRNLVNNFYIPDITFIFNASDDVIKCRFENFRKYEKLPDPMFNKMVRDNYESFTKQFEKHWNIKQIDGSNNINDIVQEMVQELDKLNTGAILT